MSSQHIHGDSPRANGSLILLLLLASAAVLLGLIGAGSARAVDPPLLVTLTVQKTGTGAAAGVVTGDGINCGGTCSAAYPSGTQVTLDAPDGPDWSFRGWDGCDQIDGGGFDCRLTLMSSRTVTAEFSLHASLALTFAGSGGGSVDTHDDPCFSSCVLKSVDGKVVPLVAHPDSGSTFAGWSGVCSGTDTSCTVVLAGHMAVTATFEKIAAPAPPEPGPPAPEPTPPPTPEPPAPAPGPVEPLPAPARCTITGTPGKDVLVGTPRRDVICGLGGNDRLAGLGGNDLLLGGRGKDVLRGGAGRDDLVGQREADVLYARDRLKDRLDGGAGRDRARVDHSKDVRKRIERTF
jgi:hypothetical protein